MRTTANLWDLARRPIANLRRGVLKFQSLLPLYSLRETIRLVQRNIIWVEISLRLEKDLAVPEAHVEPKVPLEVQLFSNDLALDTWDCRDHILKIRGEYGISQFAERLARASSAPIGMVSSLASCGSNWPPL